MIIAKYASMQIVILPLQTAHACFGRNTKTLTYDMALNCSSVHAHQAVKLLATASAAFVLVPTGMCARMNIAEFARKYPKILDQLLRSLLELVCRWYAVNAGCAPQHCKLRLYLKLSCDTEFDYYDLIVIGCTIMQ